MNLFQTEYKKILIQGVLMEKIIALMIVAAILCFVACSVSPELQKSTDTYHARHMNFDFHTKI